MNVEGASIYWAVKAAIKSLTRNAAIELAGRNIRVNAISPGPKATEIIKNPGLSDEQFVLINDRLADQVR